MSRFIFLVDGTGRKLHIDKVFSFGRSHPDYQTITARVSRSHFQIEPLSVSDYRSNHGLNCAALTLKGRYLRITSSTTSHCKEYSNKDNPIFIQHRDKLDLVSKEHQTEQVTLTVIDPLKLSANNNNPRKRKRSSTTSMEDQADEYSNSNKKKKVKYSDHSIMYDYRNSANHNHMLISSNVDSLMNPSSRSPSPSKRNLNQKLSPNSLNLTGIMSPSNVDSNPSSSSSAKYGNFPSFSNDHNNANDQPVADKEKEDADAVIHDEEKHIMVDSDDEDLIDQWLSAADSAPNAKKNKNETKEKELEDEKKEKEKMEENELYEEGRYSIAIPIVDANRYKFEMDRVLHIICSALKQFLTIHRHPKLKVVVIATGKHADQMQAKLMEEFKGRSHAMNEPIQQHRKEMPISLDLDIEDDANENKYKLFELDERIVVYSGSWNDIIRLKDHNLCCQYIVNWTFWNFDGRKGDKLNKLINKSCCNLSQISIAQHQTAKKRCTVYPVAINEQNGGPLFNEQNIRRILQIRPPSLNPNGQDYVANKEEAYSELRTCYTQILQTFYKLTQLARPSKNEFIQRDVQNWNNKPLIKKEIMSLTQNSNNNNNGNDMADSSNSHHSALIDLGSDTENLHFSLTQVPQYQLPELSNWPKYEGHDWMNALAVYLPLKSERDSKWNSCIFYEDSEFVVIYDRFFKAKYHLLIMPRVRIKSVYDLDPYNSAHIDMIEGMIARAKWIQIALYKRDKSIDRIKYGFHAIPSMNQLHLHLISDDMNSDNMKNKKHFHSFTSRYFIPAKIMLKCLKNEKKRFKVNKKYYDSLLKQKLKCHKCSAEIRTIPALKAHIKACRVKKKQSHKNSSFEMSDDEEQNFEIVFDKQDPKQSKLDIYLHQ